MERKGAEGVPPPFRFVLLLLLLLFFFLVSALLFFSICSMSYSKIASGGRFGRSRKQEQGLNRSEGSFCFPPLGE